MMFHITGMPGVGSNPEMLERIAVGLWYCPRGACVAVSKASKRTKDRFSAYQTCRAIRRCLCCHSNCRWALGYRWWHRWLSLR
mgnify:CR=1 FL=1